MANDGCIIFLILLSIKIGETIIFIIEDLSHAYDMCNKFSSLIIPSETLNILLLSLYGSLVMPPILSISLFTNATDEFLSIPLLTDKTPGTIQ